MRNFMFLAPLALLAACGSEVQQPPAATVAPAATGNQSREVTFLAQNDDAAVVARCEVTGPGYSRSFVTPAKVALPLTANNRAAVDSLSCSSGGVTRAWTAIPGEETTIVLVEYGQSLGEIWFERPNRSVLYFTRAGKLVRVSGSPPA